MDLNIVKNEKKKYLTSEGFYYNGEFLAALKEIEQFLTFYPKDMKALILKGKILRMLKDNNAARELFISLFPGMENNLNYKIQVLIELIYLEIYEKEYLTAYSYLTRLEKIASQKNITNLNIELAGIYLKKQSNMKIRKRKNKNNYFESQISDFKEEQVLERLHNKNNIINIENTRIFDKDVDLNKLYKEIKEVIPYAEVTPAYNIFDTYIFVCPKVGYDENGILNHVQVLAYKTYEGNINILEISPFRVKKYKQYINDFIDLEVKKDLTSNELELKRKNKFLVG